MLPPSSCARRSACHHRPPHGRPSLLRLSRRTAVSSSSSSTRFELDLPAVAPGQRTVPTTACPPHHLRLPPRPYESHPRPPPLVSASPSDPPYLVHQRTGLPLTTTLPGQSLPASRNRATKPPVAKGISLPCFRCHGPEGPSGLGCF
jgi:hypothetical protein